jgi:hypothetical protein
MASDTEYSFEMFALRRDLLAMVAEKVREGQPEVAKQKGKTMVLRRSSKHNSRNAEAFETAFENAQDMIAAGGNVELEIEAAPPVLRDEDHDGVIVGSEIDGRVTEIIRSIDNSGWGGSEESIYPVVAHDSGYRVCLCPAQKNFIICKHTLARVIERNKPVPVQS